MTTLEIALLFIVPSYAVGACLMMALWSRIPPRTVFWEILFSLYWPLYLPIMILAAFIYAIVRAITDQNGEFAGLPKDTKWVRERKRQELL